MIFFGNLDKTKQVEDGQKIISITTQMKNKIEKLHNATLDYSPQLLRLSNN
jgi:hypothetical protein